MKYITSSGDQALPKSVGEWENPRWWNLWARREWPYQELAVGDLLYWYDKPSKCIVWMSRVTDVRGFPYGSKRALRRELQLSKSDSDYIPYFQKAPERGYCLLFRFNLLKKIHFPKPDDLRLPQLGWRHLDKKIAKKWFGKAVVVEGGSTSRLVKRGAGFGDQETNKKVEQAAVRIVKKSLRREGWNVTKAKPGCGYDLLCRRKGDGLHVEVKGVQGVEQAFNITLGEVRQAERDQDFHLSVVTSALTMHHRIFDYSGEEFRKRFNLRVLQYRASQKS